MGTGITNEFKGRFPALKGLWRRQGKVKEAILVVDGPRRIFNLIRKSRFWDKPTYASLEEALSLKKRQCIELGVCQLAMPTIGCEWDQLNWPKVCALKQNIFQWMDVEIIIYHWKMHQSSAGQ